MQEAVQQASERVGVQLQLQEVCFTVGGAPVADWQVRTVGAEAITIVATERQSGAFNSQILDRLTALEAQNVVFKADNAVFKEENAVFKAENVVFKEEHAVLKAQNVVFKAQLAVSTVPRLQNIVAQVLLLAWGKDFFTTTSTRFRNLRAEKQREWVQLAMSMDMEPARLLKEADECLTIRNRQMHPSNLATLEKEVAAVTSLLTPELERLCPLESNLLKKFEVIKASFPTRFRM